MNRNEYRAAKPLIDALEEDLCQYFEDHKVVPAHAVIAMLNIIAVITVDSLKEGKIANALEGGQHILEAMTEVLADRTARAIENGRLK